MLPSPLFFASTLSRLATRFPFLVHAAAWTALLTLAVAVASFSAEVAFVSAISPPSPFSRACESGSYVRVPTDSPGEIVCLPAHRFVKSKIDFVVPPVFAAVIVTCSAYVVRAVALWEADRDHGVHWA